MMKTLRNHVLDAQAEASGLLRVLKFETPRQRADRSEGKTARDA